MNTTLTRIHDSHIYKKDEALLLHRLGKTEVDNEPLSIDTILRLTDLKIATHCLRTISGHDDKLRLFAIELLQPLRANVPEQHQHLFDRTMQLATDYANNKVNSAVRATHQSSGISVVSMDSRSQHQNKKIATTRLFLKLQEFETNKLKDLVQEKWNNQTSITRGNPVKIFRGDKFSE